MNILSINPSLRIWRLAITGLVCLSILSSCTMKSLYLQLDWLIPQFIEEYIPLDDKQAQQLKLNLQKTLYWHRSTQLPEYIRWLKLLKKEINQGLKQDQVMLHTWQLEQFWKTLLNYIAEDSATLLFSTRQEQRDQLFKNFQKQNSKYQKKHIEPDAETLRHNLVTQISDEFERWLGYLEPAQRELIDKATKKMKPMGQLHLDNRLILQNRLKFLLDTTTSPEKFKVEIKELFSHWENLYTKEYLDAINYNKAILINLVVEIAFTLSDEQQKYLFHKIDYYINIFNELLIKNNLQIKYYE